MSQAARQAPKQPPMRRAVVAAMAPLLAALLGGCGSMGAVMGDSVWITPNKYQFHNCKQLMDIETGNRKRTKDLEELMAKAAQSPGGAIVGTLAYRTEYQQRLGEKTVVENVIGEKRCRVDRDSVSAQSVF